MDLKIKYDWFFPLQIQGRHLQYQSGTYVLPTSKLLSWPIRLKEYERSSFFIEQIMHCFSADIKKS